MRRILVDRARAKLTEKRGGGAEHIELGDVPASFPDKQLLTVSDALERLAESKPDQAKLIDVGR
jgi:ECF sigma factor